MYCLGGTCVGAVAAVSHFPTDQGWRIMVVLVDIVMWCVVVGWRERGCVRVCVKEGRPGAAGGTDGTPSHTSQGMLSHAYVCLRLCLCTKTALFFRHASSHVMGA